MYSKLAQYVFTLISRNPPQPNISQQKSYENEDDDDCSFGSFSEYVI